MLYLPPLDVGLPGMEQDSRTYGLTVVGLIGEVRHGKKQQNAERAGRCVCSFLTRNVYRCPSEHINEIQKDRVGLHGKVMREKHENLDNHLPP